MFSQVYAFDVLPERREEFRTLSLRHIAECLRDEPGFVRFYGFQDESDENRFYAVESYVDLAAQQAHANGAILERNFPFFAPMLSAMPTLLGRGFDLESTADSTLP